MPVPQALCKLSKLSDMPWCYALPFSLVLDAASSLAFPHGKGSLGTVATAGHVERFALADALFLYDAVELVNLLDHQAVCFDVGEELLAHLLLGPFGYTSRGR